MRKTFISFELFLIKNLKIFKKRNKSKRKNVENV